MNNKQRFELLSAYLDRELSAEETEKVEQWLSYDQKAQKTYQSLLQLRHHLRKTPVPSSQTSPALLSEKVTTQARVRCFRQGLLWTSSAIAATFVTVITTVLSASDAPSPKLVKSEQVNASALQIAVNQPIMEIPFVKEKEALSTSPNP